MEQAATQFIEQNTHSRVQHHKQFKDCLPTFDEFHGVSFKGNRDFDYLELLTKEYKYKRVEVDAYDMKYYDNIRKTIDAESITKEKFFGYGRFHNEKLCFIFYNYIFEFSKHENDWFVDSRNEYKSIDELKSYLKKQTIV